MKNIGVIFTLCVLTCNYSGVECIAEFLQSLFSPAKSQTSPPEIQNDIILKQYTTDPQYDSLIILIAKSPDDESIIEGTFANPKLNGKYIRSDNFVDYIYACPEPNEKKDVEINNTLSVTKKALFIKTKFTSIVEEEIEKRKSELAKKAKQDVSTIHETNESEIVPLHQDQNSVKETNLTDDILSQEDKKKVASVQETNHPETTSSPKSSLVDNVLYQGNNNKISSVHQTKEQDITSVQKNNTTDNALDERMNNTTDNALDERMERGNKVVIVRKTIEQNIASVNSPETDLLSRSSSTDKVLNQDNDKNEVNSVHRTEKQYVTSVQENNATDDAANLNRSSENNASFVHETTEQVTSVSPTKQPNDEVNQENEASSIFNVEEKNAAFIADLNKTESIEDRVNETEELESEEDEQKRTLVKMKDKIAAYKCHEPIIPTFHEIKVRNLTNKVYLVGFEIFMKNYEEVSVARYTKWSDEFGWFQGVMILYDENTLNVLCVSQIMQTNNNMSSPDINNSFENHDLGKEILFPDVDIARLYEISNQETVFGNLFENEDLKKTYFDPNQDKFLERIHLAPLHTFVTPLVAQTAMTYGNVAPMWSVIKHNAWRRVEDYIDVLTSVLIDIFVVTGTYGTLELSGKEISLADGKLPVPLAHWKLVTFTPSEDGLFLGIFIVTTNNPYEDIGNILCDEDESHQYGWQEIQEDDFTKGRTICCKFTQEISKQLPVLQHMFHHDALNLKLVDIWLPELWLRNESGKPMTERDRLLLAKKLASTRNIEKVVREVKPRQSLSVDTENTLKIGKNNEITNEHPLPEQSDDYIQTKKDM